jgi:endonuclease/exonuclease/phosphatase family metal-dependent hydrolase
MRMIKKLLLAVSFFSLLFLSLPAMALLETTYVVFTNNTSKPQSVKVSLVTNDPKYKKGKNWGGESTILKPYENRIILWVNRNAGLIYKNYDFYLSLEQGSVIHFKLIPQIVVGSALSTRLKLPKQAEKDILQDDGLFHFQVDTDSKIHARTWHPKMQLFNSYHFALDNEKPISVPAEKNTELSVLTYNTQMMPFYANGIDDLNNPSQRALLIPKMTQGYDVVMLEELFDRDLRATVIKAMSEAYPYHTNVVGANTSKPLTGGVMIFSKWPILKEDQMVYTNSSGLDKFAAKGVMYALIDKQGKHYHVFATHTAAGDATAKDARKSELMELSAFVQSQQIPNNEPVFLGGDFNIDEKNDEFIQLKDILHVDLPINQGYPYSFDSVTNSMNLGKEQSRLDYVFYSNDYLHPAKSYNKVFVLRALYDEAMWPQFDLSDHYPVASYFDFS